MLTKVHIVKAMVFPEVMYGCESRAVKKVEHQRFAAFELEKALESLLDSKEVKVSLKGLLIGRIDAEVPVLWPHDVNG